MWVTTRLGQAGVRSASRRVDARRLGDLEGSAENRSGFRIGYVAARSDSDEAPAEQTAFERVVTVGYLILEASSVFVSARPGESSEVRADIIGYDHDSDDGTMMRLQGRLVRDLLAEVQSRQ